ncbi:branched-chain amino acid ABC transporter permease [Azospirillum thermophilum]|uniref:Branched-chain amino acid ABC transporter permease n=1 Tax=Azospirillum thermophilum TaxID=2202148 RepID=A0A2S2CKK8_9PROT|nr:branched-chain amino acid ABC transporter permease [Azospirillum thermophilum]AWK84847.1 branched-chain amino acid ABC transporter permease [Azospirillum thermophilum]
MFELILQALFSGVLAGGYYATVAVGLALVFGTMRVINLAHGELVLLAAYIAYAAESRYGMNPVAAIPFALLIVGATSAAIYGLLSRIEEDREINSLILTFGIGIILTNAILMIWAADIHSTTDAWFQDSMVIADTLFAMRAEVVFFVGGLALMAGVYWWLNHSWQGRAVRALSSNRNAAKLMGVNPRQTEVLSFLLAALLATFAGIAIYTGKTIFPALGHVMTVKAFIITVLAGLGSIPGVLVGALMIGVIESLTVTFFSASLQELAGMILFLVVLFVSPSGLFGGRKALAR